jgi:FkbM family methyltransferase
MSVKYFTQTYPQASLVAIETEASNLEMARKNNSNAEVKFLLCGIGNEDAKADIQDPGEGNWAYRLEASESGSTHLVSVNSLLQQYPQAQFTPFVIKIDIEGFESNLFEKNTAWIDQFPVIIIELHDWMLPRQANARRFLQQISARDRDFVFYGETVFSVSNTLV